MISCFRKEDDKLVKEIKIDFIELETLKKIFSPLKDDPLMYYPYDIDKDIGKMISNYIEIEFDFDTYVYQLDCFQK